MANTYVHMLCCFNIPFLLRGRCKGCHSTVPGVKLLTELVGVGIQVLLRLRWDNGKLNVEGERNVVYSLSGPALGEERGQGGRGRGREEE